MAVNTYDPQKCLITISDSELGAATMTGFADGAFVTIEQDDDSFAVKVGADGEVARAKKHNRSATMKLTFLATSEMNAFLTALHDNDSVFSIRLKDGDNEVFARDAWVSKPASVERSVEVADAEWTITLAKVEFDLGGNP